MKMKRKNISVDEHEAKLSSILFSKSKKLAEKLSTEVDSFADLEQKPVWFDEDDEHVVNPGPKTKEKIVYANKLKQKYEVLMGTPSWARLGKKDNIDDDDNSLLRVVGHLQKSKSLGLKKDFLEIKKFPKVNEETGNEGPIISCIEFHPKISVVLVGGQSGIISLFSIGGDINTKLHSFKLKKWKVTKAQFTPNGSQAFIASKLNHSYCVYDLVKAEPKLVQLPKIVKRPKLFKISPDGKYLVASDGLDEVYVICAKSNELIQSLKHNSNVESITFSPNCDRLFCYGIQGEISIWDMSTYKVINKFIDQGCVTASEIMTSPCGRLLATGSGEGIVNIYETNSLGPECVPIKTISNLTTKITNLTFNSTTEILAMSSGYFPNAVKLVHLPSYHVFCNFPQKINLYQVETIGFSPNSGYMALGNNKGCAYLYRLKHYKNY